MRKITLRPALPEDEPFLRLLYASTRQEEMALVDWDEATRRQFVTMQFQAQLQHYRTYFPAADHQLILCEQPVGRLYVDRRADELHLLDLSLLPEWRNQGIGLRIMEELLEEAACSRQPLRLHVWQGNQAGLRFYHRLGLETVDRNGMYILMEKMT